MLNKVLTPLGNVMYYKKKNIKPVEFRRSSNLENENMSSSFNKPQKRISHIIPIDADGSLHSILASMNEIKQPVPPRKCSPTKPKMKKPNYKLSVKKTGPLYDKVQAETRTIARNLKDGMQRKAHMNSFPNTSPNHPLPKKISAASSSGHFALSNAFETAVNPVEQMNASKNTSTCHSAVKKNALKSYKIPKISLSKDDKKIDNSTPKTKAIKASASTAKKSINTSDIATENQAKPCKVSKTTKPSAETKITKNTKKHRTRAKTKECSTAKKTLVKTKECSNAGKARAKTEECSNAKNTRSAQKRKNTPKEKENGSKKVRLSNDAEDEQMSNLEFASKITNISFPESKEAVPDSSNISDSLSEFTDETKEEERSEERVKRSRKKRIRRISSDTEDEEQNLESESVTDGCHAKLNEALPDSLSESVFNNDIPDNSSTHSNIGSESETVSVGVNTDIGYEPSLPLIEDIRSLSPLISVDYNNGDTFSNASVNENHKVIDIITLEDDESDDEIEIINVVPAVLNKKSAFNSPLNSNTPGPSNVGVKELFKKPEDENEENLNIFFELYKLDKQSEIEKFLTRKVCYQCKKPLEPSKVPCASCSLYYCDTTTCQIQHRCIG